MCTGKNDFFLAQYCVSPKFRRGLRRVCLHAKFQTTSISHPSNIFCIQALLYQFITIYHLLNNLVSGESSNLVSSCVQSWCHNRKFAKLSCGPLIKTKPLNISEITL